jgi:2-hydroxy-6-oxonona-2,4-dienedioate hydrolase
MADTDSNMYPSLHEVQTLAERIELETPSGRQIWHVWHRNAGNPLVLLHGGSGSWNHWLRNVLPLSENRAVWALDTPGMGDSALPPGALDANDLHQPLEQGLRLLFGNHPLDMVGFSFGGLIAGYLAAHARSRVKRMVLVGMPGLGLSNQIVNMKGFRNGMTLEERRAVHHNNLMAIMLQHENNISDALLEMQEQNVQRDRMRRRRIARSDAMLQIQLEWQCPVYGVWGENDALYKGSLHLIPGLLSNCDLRGFHVVPDAGHWVQYEQPALFNTILQAALH